MAKSGKKVVAATIVGAAAGAVAGVMLAPKSGKETRKDLATQAEKLKKNAVEKIDSSKNKVQHLKNKTKGAIHEARSKAIEKADEIEQKSRSKLQS